MRAPAWFGTTGHARSELARSRALSPGPRCRCSQLASVSDWAATATVALSSREQRSADFPAHRLPCGPSEVPQSAGSQPPYCEISAVCEADSARCGSAVADDSLGVIRDVSVALVRPSKASAVHLQMAADSRVVCVVRGAGRCEQMICGEAHDARRRNDLDRASEPLVACRHEVRVVRPSPEHLLRRTVFDACARFLQISDLAVREIRGDSSFHEA